MEVKYIEHLGSDQAIAQAARVSTVGENTSLEYAGLLNYLMRERHGSPWEMGVVKFYIKAPIFVFREFHRHRMASYNERSGRYSELKDEFWYPTPDRILVNSGTSAKPEFTGEPDIELHELVTDELYHAYSVAWGSYQKLLGEGVANEVARAVLPVGIYSEMYATMNLRSIFNFLSLRTHKPDAVHVSRPQREIEIIAEQMEEIVEGLFPVALETFNKYGRVAP